MLSKNKLFTAVLIVFLIAGVFDTSFAVTLTSVTLDPENSSGVTTNAPGAWSTNTGDPLAQVGIIKNGIFLNQGAQSGLLEEVSIKLEPGLNTFTLVGNGTFAGNLFYGAVLFFDGVATPPQAAVYNENNSLSMHLIQSKGSKIMGGANGGLFFDTAPGTSVFTAPDGTQISVVEWVVDSASTQTDEISYTDIGADGNPDTTAKLILNVTPPITADLNGDGNVDGKDLAVMADQYGQ